MRSSSGRYSNINILSVLGDDVMSHNGEFCEGEVFNVTCAVDQVMQVRSARYGRMQLGRCVEQTYGTFPCSVDVTAHVDGECGGRRNCAFPVISLKKQQSPCSIDLRSYLEVEYICTSGKYSCTKY